MKDTFLFFTVIKIQNKYTFYQQEFKKKKEQITK